METLRLFQVYKKIFVRFFGIKINSCTTFASKTDRQSEISNQEIEKHLYIFLNDQKDDWLEKQVIAQS